MQKLRPVDGTARHKKYALYHLGALRSVDAPLPKQLGVEMAALVGDLKARARATEDADDAHVQASAEADAAEAAVEDGVRRVDAALILADQGDPSLNAQRTVFPGGFGVIIDAEGEDQLGTLPRVYVPVTPFRSIPAVGAAVSQLEAAETAFRERLDEESAALEASKAAFAAELEARRRIREQIDSAYGRLCDFYKGRTKRADRMFLREPRDRKDGAKAAAPAPADASPS